MYKEREREEQKKYTVVCYRPSHVPCLPPDPGALSSRTRK